MGQFEVKGEGKWGYRGTIYKPGVYVTDDPAILDAAEGASKGTVTVLSRATSGVQTVVPKMYYDPPENEGGGLTTETMRTGGRKKPQKSTPAEAPAEEREELSGGEVADVNCPACEGAGMRADSGGNPAGCDYCNGSGKVTEFAAGGIAEKISLGEIEVEPAWIFEGILNDAQVAAIEEAGIDFDDIDNVSDEDLLAVKGVGEATVAKMREALAAETAEGAE